ncbi:hypothetical protein G9A89_010341 [Geosiphon pyriformis]|nr:hypothetical protein G9A89_010341 [Geosiphon pyriformis]
MARKMGQRALSSLWINITQQKNVERHSWLRRNMRCVVPRITIAKIERVSLKEIREIKNNPPEPIELDWDPEPVINLLDPEQFHKHYQELTPTREE